MKNTLYRLLILISISLLWSNETTPDSTIEEFHNNCIYDDLDAVKKIVSQNPDFVNSKDQYGFTALHNIGAEEVYEIASFLITRGADVNAVNNEGVTPLFTAGDPGMLNLIINNGANLNHQSHDGSTALHSFAAEQDSDKNIALLLKYGADRSITNNKGELPIDIARSRKESKKVALLKTTKPWWKFW